MAAALMASDISDWFFRYSRCCWRRNIGQVQASQNLKGKKNDLDFEKKIKKIKKEAEEYFFDPATVEIIHIFRVLVFT